MIKINKAKCACPGIIEGKITPSLNEEGILFLDNLKPNDYLNPKKTKGLILKKGGLLSHGAIIAREFNIPCLIGTGELTQLKKGVKVKLNATEKHIKIIN